MLYRLWRVLSRHDVLSEPHEGLVTDLAVTAKHNLIERVGEVGCQKGMFSPSDLSALVHRFESDLKNSDCFLNASYSGATGLAFILSSSPHNPSRSSPRSRISAPVWVFTFFFGIEFA